MSSRPRRYRSPVDDYPYPEGEDPAIDYALDSITSGLDRRLVESPTPDFRDRRRRPDFYIPSESSDTESRPSGSYRDDDYQDNDDDEDDQDDDDDDDQDDDDDDDETIDSWVAPPGDPRRHGDDRPQRIRRPTEWVIERGSSASTAQQDPVPEYDYDTDISDPEDRMRWGRRARSRSPSPPRDIERDIGEWRDVHDPAPEYDYDEEISDPEDRMRWGRRPAPSRTPPPPVRDRDMQDFREWLLRNSSFQMGPQEEPESDVERDPEEMGKLSPKKLKTATC